MLLKRRRQTFRPAAEALEARDLMAGVTFVVTSTADSGPGTLRRAINLSNETAPSAVAPNLITFHIPGRGVHNIDLLSELPPITNAVLIDGYTQPGSSVNTKPITSAHSNDAVRTVQVTQDDGFSGALRVNRAGAGSTIRGLSFLLEGKYADGITLVRTHNVTVSGNSFFRFNTNFRFNVAVWVLGGRDNTIGGSAQFPQAQNVMGQYAHGVVISHASKHNGIINNIIGQSGGPSSASQINGVQLAPNADHNVVENNGLFGNKVAVRNDGSGNVLLNNRISNE